MPRVSNPGSMACAAWSPRTSSPAAISNTRQTAICAVTSDPRSQPAERPPVVVPDSFSAELRSGFEACSAGISIRRGIARRLAGATTARPPRVRASRLSPDRASPVANNTDDCAEPLTAARQRSRPARWRSSPSAPTRPRLPARLSSSRSPSCYRRAAGSASRAAAASAPAPRTPFAQPWPRSKQRGGDFAIRCRIEDTATSTASQSHPPESLA